MKKIYLFSAFCISFLVHSQVGIGKASVDGDGILDFEFPATGGIVLPAVTNIPFGPGATNGTLVYDYNEGCVKFRQNNQWIKLSFESGNTSNINLNTSVDNGNGVIIGSNTSSAEGVLVLESQNKALILPKIDSPHLNLINPHPGTICYDTRNKTLVVFDGSKWYHWK
ncbi:MAG: hypothetical protein ACK4M1_06410 [Flavobacterium sp.]